jgi:hypothetical protein
VKFRISTHAAAHSATSPPADAMELLWKRLGPRREDATFARVGADIAATWSGDEHISSSRDERAEVGRHAVLEIVSRVCDGAPELTADWFAVSFLA